MNTFVNKYSFGFLLVMKPTSLLNVDSNEACYRHHQHGNKPSEFSQCNGEDDKADEGDTDGCRRQSLLEEKR